MLLISCCIEKTHARECSTFPYDLAAHPINPVDASVPGQQYMGCCRNLFLTPITPILGMQHLCCLCEIHYGIFPTHQRD